MAKMFVTAMTYHCQNTADLIFMFVFLVVLLTHTLSLALQ
jgi:hypothetical protein